MTIGYRFSKFKRFGMPCNLVSECYISFHTRNGEESYSYYDLDSEKGRK